MDLNPSEIKDAFIYSKIKNNLTDNEFTDSTLASKLSNKIDMKNYKKELDNILDMTTIKRACCVNHKRDGVTGDSYKVNVRIPIPTNHDFTTTAPHISQLQKKFGYIDKIIDVPKTLCDKIGYDYYSDKCDIFMDTYCNNVKSQYQDELSKINEKYNDNEFSYYKPECSCYGNIPDPIAKSGYNIAKNCYMPNCDVGNMNVFLDRGSRQPCNATICSAINQIAGSEAGKDIVFNTKIQQTCGSGISTITQPTPEPTITQPIIVQPTITQPTITQPTITQPTITQPTITQPTPEPTITQPTPEPTITQPTIESSSIESSNIELSPSTESPKTEQTAEKEKTNLVVVGTVLILILFSSCSMSLLIFPKNKLLISVPYIIIISIVIYLFYKSIK